MALGRRKRESQAQLWVATQNLTAPGHPFYKKLNRVLDKHGFDAFVEAQCAKYYAEGVGRPGIPPGVYFRLLMIGYFEGINSERAIAWRVADSLSLRQFLGYELDQATPDHSSVSRTRRLMDYQTHHEVFDWAHRCGAILLPRKRQAVRVHRRRGWRAAPARGDASFLYGTRCRCPWTAGNCTRPYEGMWTTTSIQSRSSSTCSRDW